MTTNSPEAQPQGGELLPCRWCLGPADLTSENNGDEGDGYMWHVFCAEENDCTMMPDLYATSKSEAVRRWNSRADLPRATGETTVEAALAELREMFPRHYCSISHEGRLVLGMSWKLKKVETVAKIRITSATIEDAMLPVEADADSLNEAMNQVRKWVAQVRADSRTEGGGEKS